MAEYRNGKLYLPDVTLTAVTSVKVGPTIMALLYSMREIEFGDVLLITHRRPFLLPRGIHYRHIRKLKEINDFNHAMIYEVGAYIGTKFMLLIHYDGFVVNPQSWDDEFLKYDYIGSPFPRPVDDFSYRDVDGHICRVGNSVSIRSKRLMELPEKAKIPFEADHGFFNEDGFICCKNRHLFLKAGMKYAPLEVAARFGRERELPEHAGVEPFVFHKWDGPNAGYPRFDR